MSDTGARAGGLATAIHEQFADMEAQIEALRDHNKTLDRAFALAEQERDQWKRRAIDAETVRDRYARFVVELLTRIRNFRDLAALLSNAFASISEDAKRIAYRPDNTGAPPPEVVFSQQDQETLDRLGKLFGFGDDKKDEAKTEETVG